MKHISLNGQWDFYKDTSAAAGKIRNSGAMDSVSLSGGNTVSASFHITNPEEIFYAKLKLSMDFGCDLAAEDGAVPTVYAKVGGGKFCSADISDFTHNLHGTAHSIDVGFSTADLVPGENTVLFKTNIISGNITVTKAVLQYYPVLMFPDMMKSVSVPGVWETQLGGDYIAYNGVGWYLRTFDLDRTDAGKQYMLTFDAIDYYAEIWLNGHFICSHEDGYSPIVIDLHEYADILQTRDNRLVVRVTDQDTSPDAEFPLKQTLAGFFHDSVGINFAGIWNDVSLACRGIVRVSDLTVRTDIESMTAEMIADIKNVGDDTAVDAVFSLLDGNEILCTKTVTDISADSQKITAVSSVLTAENGELWEIASPKLYTARVELKQGNAVIDCCEDTFGFTQVRANGDKVLFNNRAVKLNGILSWLGNWEQISPKFDPDVFTQQIRTLKDLGYNAIKFCLVVPQDELLDICDREGIYVYIEYPVWNPVQTDAFYERGYSQIGRFLRMSKNHPSVIMSDFNCEMIGFDEPMLQFMNWCVAEGKRIDPNRLYADNSTTGQQNTEGGNDFWTWHPYTNALGFSDYAKIVVKHRSAHGVKPLVFGEYADYPSLTDFDAVFEANEGKVPWNWNVVDDPFRADLYLARLGYSHEQIAGIVGYSRTNCIDMKMHYVQETKKADAVAAYFLTIIQDVGHSVTGMFDELGKTKFTPEQTGFLKESVLLLDTNQYSFTGGKNASVTPAVSHYDGTDIQNGTLAWSLIDKNGNTAAGGILEKGICVNNGCFRTFEKAELPMPDVSAAAAHTLVLRLTADNGYEISSRWEVYLYPETAHDALTAEKTVMVADEEGMIDFLSRHPSAAVWEDGAAPDLLIAVGKLTDAQIKYLNDGGKVLYLGAGSEVAKVEKGVYYSQYVLVHFPREDHEIVRALDSKGFGGLQFLGMQTTNVITEARETPLTHSIIGKLLLRDNVGDIGQSASYMSEFTVGQGKVIQCTLNFKGDTALGNYLIDTSAAYLLK